LHGSSPSEDLAYEEVVEQEERKRCEPDLLGKSEEDEKKVTPMKIGGPEGTTIENKLLASPIMRDIAKVGKTEAGMFGLMYRLAEAVVESTERIKTLETKHYPVKRASEPDSTSEQLAKMTAMMGRMMARMEDLEDRKKVSHYVKVEPNAVTPSKENTKHWYGVGHGRDGPKVYLDWGETARVVNRYLGAIYQRSTQPKRLIDSSKSMLASAKKRLTP
jgi:hypothetical protein